jgi:hypothetical protein
LTTNPVAVKFKQAFDLLLMRRTESAAYVLHTTVDHVPDTSREDLARVARALTDGGAVGLVEKVSLAERSSQ